MLTLSCHECGVEFKRHPSRVGKNNYCSKACQTLGRTKHRTKDDRLAAGRRKSEKFRANNRERYREICRAGRQKYYMRQSYGRYWECAILALKLAREIGEQTK